MSGICSAHRNHEPGCPQCEATGGVMEKYMCDKCWKMFSGPAEGILSYKGIGTMYFCKGCTKRFNKIIRAFLGRGDEGYGREIIIGGYVADEHDGETMATGTWGGAGPDCRPEPEGVRLND